MLQVLEDASRRKGKWIWRCHIDLSAPYRPVWDFFEPIVNRYDAAIFTAEEYVQPGVQGPIRAFIPPSIDPLSPKNASMTESTWRGVLTPFGVDPDRPLVTQVSRFDPWKDPLGVIDAFRLVRREVPDAQLALVGSLAHDDPEGIRYLDLTTDHAAGDPDIHLLTNLSGVGDIAVNAFQRASDVSCRSRSARGSAWSSPRGCGSASRWSGVTWAGIRLQIVDGVTGYLVNGSANARIGWSSSCAIRSGAGRWAKRGASSFARGSCACARSTTRSG